MREAKREFAERGESTCRNVTNIPRFETLVCAVTSRSSFSDPFPATQAFDGNGIHRAFPGADSGMVTRVATSGVLYGVFDYVDESRRLNEIRGGAIIQQLVCSRVLLLNVNAEGRRGAPIDPFRRAALRQRRNNGFRTPSRESASSSPFPPSSQETQRGGARRSQLWNAARVPIRRVPSGSFRPVRHVPVE